MYTSNIGATKNNYKTFNSTMAKHCISHSLILSTYYFYNLFFVSFKALNSIMANIAFLILCSCLHIFYVNFRTQEA